MGKYDRLGKNTLLIFVGNIGSRVITFFLLPFYTIWLSKGEYGTVDLIFTYVSLLTGVVTCSIAESIFRFPKNEPKERQVDYFCSGLIFSTVCLALTALLFLLINVLWKQSSNIFIKYIWVIYLIVFVNFIQTYLKQFTRSIDKMTVYVFSGLVLTFSTLLFSFILIPRFKIEGYVFTQIGSSVVTIIYIFFHGKIKEYISWQKARVASCREMLKYAIPLIPHSVMWWVISALNRPLIESQDGLDALGIFAVAIKLPSMISLVFSIFFWSWQISVLEEYKKEDYAVFYNRIFRFVFSCLIFLSFVLTVCSHFLVKLIVDDLFLDAWRYIPVLSMGVVFSCLTTLVSANFLAAKETKYSFFSTTIGAFVSIAFNFILIPLWGLMGASVSFGISFGVMLLVSLLFSRKYVILTSSVRYIISLLLNILLILAVLYTSSILYKSLFILLLALIQVILNIAVVKEICLILKSLWVRAMNKYNNSSL